MNWRTPLVSTDTVMMKDMGYCSIVRMEQTLE
jgi:hypothetical protein